MNKHDTCIKVYINLYIHFAIALHKICFQLFNIELVSIALIA